MSSNEISVEMSQEYVLDLERMFAGEGDVLVGVALWINHSCGASSLVSNDVGSVR